uniref:Uncharacterized protein n=1 Tax=viral metagenome TaxID=1070528 RepID=A0A6C0E252_9ZZZZ
MSSSRSVAAAQRRRAGPTSDTPTARGPSTSINSSQVFSQNQTQTQQQGMRPGTTGRLAGQQAAVSQQQHLQSNQTTENTGLNPLKMSIPQAITLVSLRLGKLENQLQNLEGLSLGESSPSQSYDGDVITHILQRLDNLEQKTNEMNVVKQQLDLLKPALVSVKNTSSGALKDISVLKTSIDHMKTELNATKVVIDDLQMYLSSDNIRDKEVVVADEEHIMIQTEVSHEIDAVSSDASVANLKDLIEQELNVNI